MIKMNKLQGLASTYTDNASSDNEFLTAGKIGKRMIMKETGCPLWCASRILEILGGRESWLPCPERMHMHGTLPTNASDILANTLNALGIRYATNNYEFGGIVYKNCNRRDDK